MVPTLAFVYGAVIASFLCVVAERLPGGRSVNGRSACVCGRQLTWWENVPVLAWAVLRGRARCCQASLPARYVVAEVALGVAWALAAVAGTQFGWALAGLAALLSAGGLLAALWPQGRDRA